MYRVVEFWHGPDGQVADRCERGNVETLSEALEVGLAHYRPENGGTVAVYSGGKLVSLVSERGL